MKFIHTPLLLCVLTSACSNRPTPAPVSEVYQGKTYRDVEKGGFQGKTYQVKKGDTLYSIAWFSGKDFRQLAAINNISAPYSIYPGQQLQLHKNILKKQKTANRKTGQTSKSKRKAAVDRPDKQAYGASKVVDKSTRNPLQQLSASTVKWQWPIKGKIIRHFSTSSSGNKGIKIAGSSGSSVVSSADGKVVYVGNALRGYGNLIIVKHNEVYLSAYAHTENILVRERQWVKGGDKIATLGSSGAARPQLHFEIRFKGKSLDPLQFLPKRK